MTMVTKKSTSKKSVSKKHNIASKLKKAIVKRLSPKRKSRVAHVALVIDSSGSMQSIRQETIKSINSTIDEIKKNAKLTPTTISQWLFGVGHGDGKVENTFFKVPAKEVKTLLLQQFVPQGGTPLLDAVGEATQRLRRDSGPKDTVLVVVITDGEENSSKSWTVAQLQAEMSGVQKTDRWTFAFMVPPRSKDRLCRHYGIPEGNVTEWEASRQGVERATIQVNSSVGGYYGNLLRGHTSSKSFFTPDLSKVSAKKIKSKLEDLQGKVLVLKVPSEIEIRTFVEMATGKSYTKGHGFYLLSKDEKKVQAYKHILVRDKATGKIYGGEDVRSVLGLPEGEIKLRPGNHANFDIFIQSTSVNRKLVRGTLFLYLK